jgi:uncharacterized membrane protein YebE (DUF533 family)
VKGIAAGRWLRAVSGLIGGGALTLLGLVAMQALRGAQSKSREPEIDADVKLTAGLREPDNAQEAQHVASIVDLTVKAMINAAKADGRIDEDEMQKVAGELQADGISAVEREFLLNEVRKPMCTEEIVRAVPNQQVAAQVYAASLLAIEADTPAEHEYLRGLARDLKLDSQVTNRLHSTLGIS